LGTVCLALLLAAPGWAQDRLDFDMPRDTAVAVPVFSAAQVGGWLGELDRRLETAASARDAATVLDAFARRLQRGRLTPAVEAAAVTALARWKARRPDLGNAVAAAQAVITRFTVGKRAPEIAGVDLAGVPLRLSDYRGKVVVLSFSGEWCGICRSEYPYQRFLIDLYETWPFEMLSVESGRDTETVRAAKATNRLSHRSWWDPGGKAQFGPIATAWQVTGWPTTYLIDAAGVIRYVDLRKEDLLKAVRFLVGEAADAR
jgi:peroxiredoxin